MEIDFKEGEWCEWMSFFDFQAHCEEQFGEEKCISVVQGSLVDGSNKFRAQFHELPYELFSFYVHWGANKKGFDMSQSEYAKYGYKLFFKQTYEDEVGKTRYQAIWVEE